MCKGPNNRAIAPLRLEAGSRSFVRRSAYPWPNTHCPNTDYAMEYGTVAPFQSKFAKGAQVDERWSFDRAVLIKVVELYKNTGEDLPSGEVLQHFPTEQRDAVLDSLCLLGSTGYLNTVAVPRGDGRLQFLRIKGVTNEGMRASGAWPDDAELLADRVLAVLAERVENEPEPEKQTKFQAGLRGLGGMTRDLLVDVLAAAIKSNIPGVGS